MVQWVPDLIALAVGLFVAVSAVVIGRDALKVAAACFVVLVIGQKLGVIEGGYALEFVAGVVLGATIVGVQVLLLKIKNRGAGKAEKLSAAGR